jgi:hypothetical protein
MKITKKMRKKSKGMNHVTKINYANRKDDGLPAHFAGKYIPYVTPKHF